MKKALLTFIVLLALPLTALLAQGDPAAAPANDPSAVPATQTDPGRSADDPAQPSTDAARDAAANPDATDDAAANAVANADPDQALPATASHGPLILLLGILAIGMFLVLKVFRRRSVNVS